MSSLLGTKLNSSLATSNNESEINFIIDDLVKSNEQLKRANTQLNNKNKEIIDSIQYARLIHQAILPKQRHFDRAFKESFFIYQPKDIIGGDFYWTTTYNELSYVILGDCTGHGIPGALLSVLAYSLLNYIVLSKKNLSCKDIITELDQRLIDSFHMTQEERFNNDWIDISICCYNNNTQQLEFSGAMQSIYLVRNENLFEFEGNKFPVGGWQIENERNYTYHTINIQRNDMIYLLSDGIPDQFGGPLNKKFNRRRLKELLLTVSNLSMDKQKEMIHHVFNKWKGDEEQVDDISLIGIRF
jgi:serine phosphatase RsbU (regulator of sigma subunit)